MRSRYLPGDPIDPAVIALYGPGLTAAALDVLATRITNSPEHCSAQMAKRAEEHAAGVARWREKAALMQAEAAGKVVEGVYRGPVAQIAGK